jgi:hypothetical protein
VSSAARADRGAGLGTPIALGVIVLLTLLSRLWVLGAASPERLQPDEAHALNVARCFARGQGFSNVEAWPAWLAPERLPTPETFKEPAYPALMAAIAGRDGDLWRAGVGISFAAGLLLPLLVWAIARRVDPDRRVAFAAGLFASASPLLIVHSVWVVVESLFAATVAAMFLATLPRRLAGDAATGADGRRRRAIGWDLAAGVLFGAAYLMRAQVLLAAPALLWAMALGRSRGELARGAALAAVASLAVMSPLLARNLREFGVPFFSNVPNYGLWPYVDRIAFSHGLEHPPAPLGFALTHLPAVAGHWLHSLVGFSRSTLHAWLLGNPLSLIPFAVGAIVALARWRRCGFLLLYPALTLAFIFAVNWAPYYFTSITPYACVLAGLGATWLWRRPGGVSATARRVGLAALAAAAFVWQASASRNAVLGFDSPELEAAKAEAPFLRSRLAPDEAVLCMTTSYWAWFADRPAVHLVIAEEVRFDAAMRRLKVRMAALPTSRLAELADRYPEGRLPAALVEERVDPARDLTVFRVALPPAERTP